MLVLVPRTDSDVVAPDRIVVLCDALLRPKTADYKHNISGSHDVDLQQTFLAENSV